MNTPNINLLRDEVLKLQHFPDESFERPDMVHFMRAIISEHVLWASVPTRQRGRTSKDEGHSLPGRVWALELAVLALQQKVGVMP